MVIKSGSLIVLSKIDADGTDLPEALENPTFNSVSERAIPIRLTPFNDSEPSVSV